MALPVSPHNTLPGRPHAKPASGGLFIQISVPPNHAAKAINHPQCWDNGFASSSRSEYSAFAMGTNQSGGGQPMGCSIYGIQPSGGPHFSRLAVEAREIFFFFFQSLVALHMVEIKGVAGCMVLLYFQALLLIRKQDQRQY